MRLMAQADWRGERVRGEPWLVVVAVGLRAVGVSQGSWGGLFGVFGDSDEPESSDAVEVERAGSELRPCSCLG